MADDTYDTIADQVENAATALDAYEQHLFSDEPIVHREGHEDSEVMLRSLLCDLLHYSDHQLIDFAATLTVARQVHADDLRNSHRSINPDGVRAQHPEPALGPTPLPGQPEVTAPTSDPPGIHPAALAAQAFPNPPAQSAPSADPATAADQPRIPRQRPGHRRP